MRTALRRTVAIATSVSLVVTVVRVVINFLESYSVVGASRRADHELLALCERETLVNEKLASACRSALAEVSSPLVLKAFLHAFRSVFAELVESTATPTKLLVLALFAVSGLGAPVVSALTREALCRRRRRRRVARLRRVVGGDAEENGGSDDDDDDDDDDGGGDDDHRHDRRDMAARLRLTVARSLGRIRSTVTSRLAKGASADVEGSPGADEGDDDHGVVLFASDGRVSSERQLRQRPHTLTRSSARVHID
jgi:hypothetical protein